MRGRSGWLFRQRSLIGGRCEQAPVPVEKQPDLAEISRKVSAAAVLAPAVAGPASRAGAKETYERSKRTPKREAGRVRLLRPQRPAVPAAVCGAQRPADGGAIARACGFRRGVEGLGDGAGGGGRASVHRGGGEGAESCAVGAVGEGEC
jgi:hypothetical protein